MRDGSCGADLVRGRPGRRRGRGAAGLAAAYWHDLYPLMPDGYRSSECRSGGALDEHLADAPWLAPARS